MTTTALAPSGSAGFRPGRWRLDPAGSRVEVAVRVGGLATVRGRFTEVAGTIDGATDGAGVWVAVVVDTASLTSGSGYWDRVLGQAGLVDAAANPVIRFDSTGLRIGDSDWWLDGLLSTSSDAMALSLQAAPPVEIDSDRLTLHARGRLPSVQATRLLGRPGVERLIGSSLLLDMDVDAVAG